MIETISAKNDPLNVQTRPTTVVASSVGMVLLSVILGAVGQLLLKVAVTSTGALTLSFDALVTMVTNPILILALATYGVSACLWLIALMKTDLSFAYPFLSLTYIVVLVGSVIFFNENVSMLRLLGFVVVMSGLFVIARDARRAASKPQV
jgi:drug/metabolite transporter (DMT)-like permease